MPDLHHPLLASFLVLLAAAGPLQAQRPAAEPFPGWTVFTRLMDAAVHEDRVVGASALVVHDGRIAARHEYGMADRARDQRVTDRTLFHYGSITKTLTAIAIMQLRDRGKLSLDDHVTRWVPELRRMHDPYGMMDSITIRMLLSHSAGFQDPTWPYKEGKPWEPFEPTTWEQLVAMMPYQELHFRPGSRFGYSNPGFIYLARIIEAITGDAWETYVQKNIFGPLGLQRSYFGVTPYWLAEDRSANYTLVEDSATRQPRVVDNGREFDPGITIPNGGWNAPLDDLATYAAFLTGAPTAGATPGKSWDIVLSRASLEEMWRPLLSTAPDATAPGDSVALSFFVTHRDGVRLVGHTGSQAGFLALLYLDPAKRNAVVVALNTSRDLPDPRGASGFERIRQGALDLLAGAAPKVVSAPTR